MTAETSPFGDADLRLPTRSYIICATPRSGSYLLCDALSACGMAGKPTEYLSVGYQRQWSEKWGIRDLHSYLRHVIDATTSSNGVFGAKTHPWQFDHFVRKLAGRARVRYKDRPQVLALWFPDLRYVWLKRRNKLRQAISYAKSLQTNVWWDADAPPAPYDEPRPEALRFDFELITQSVARLVEEEDMWRRYFRAIDISPLVIYYEDLVEDPLGALGSVFQTLDLELPPDYKMPPARFRQQADDVTERWERRYRSELARGPYELRRRVTLRRAAGSSAPARSSTAIGAGPVSQLRPVRNKVREPADSKRDPATLPVPEVDLSSVLSSRRWMRCESPFPHVYALDVFETKTYQAISDQFEGLLSGGHFSRSIPGYDVTAYTITAHTSGPLSIFTSRAWHDMLARMFGVNATMELNVALHHHAIGSQSGSPHNDLNPGWFADKRRPDGIVVQDPADHCDYRYGSEDPGIRTVERIRAIAVIMYMANPVTGYRGGETGLYRSTSDEVDKPASAIPPRNNSLVAFECTPYSFHGFIHNPRTVRNCLVMWLHRDKAEAVCRFGDSSIVYWAR
jgi:LPS sulfotransferase NodH